MPRSMTGFGEGSVGSEFGGVSVEVRCLNHRHREFKVRLPRDLAAIEPVVISLVSKKIERGSVEVVVRYTDRPPFLREVRIDRNLADQAVQAMRSLKTRYGLQGDIRIDSLISIDGVFEVSERKTANDKVHQMVEDALSKALDAAVLMRDREGLALERDLVDRLRLLSDAVVTISGETEDMLRVYRERLESRIKALVDTASIDPGRMEMEVAILADRSDISEELTRLGSHLDQFKQLVEDKQSSVGRKMGFLLQELVREINTIGNKCQNIRISSLVVDMKAELERIREQVQNIE